MDILKKLFKSTEQGNPNNTRLAQLMTQNSKDRSHLNFELVISELLNGNCTLLIPSLHNENVGNNWSISEGNLSLRITSVVEVGGLQVLGVFTDEAALTNWAKTKAAYTEILAKDVLKLAKMNGFNRIVVNSGSPNIFILEQNKNY